VDEPILSVARPDLTPTPARSPPPDGQSGRNPRMTFPPPFIPCPRLTAGAGAARSGSSSTTSSPSSTEPRPCKTHRHRGWSTPGKERTQPTPTARKSRAATVKRIVRDPWRGRPITAHWSPLYGERLRIRRADGWTHEGGASQLGRSKTAEALRSGCTTTIAARRLLWVAALRRASASGREQLTTTWSARVDSSIATAVFV
jgi:hypothetical protein